MEIILGVMSEAIEILPLRPFSRGEIEPFLAGYATGEIYSVRRREEQGDLGFDIRLTPVDPPFRDSFDSDFTPEECANWFRLIPLGACFGAYQGERLAGLAIAEAKPDERHLRVWEFHIHPELHRQGIGRRLMARVLQHAEAAGLPQVMLETQNTNVYAIRFYRAMGFHLEAIDQTLYMPASSQTAFFMKYWFPRKADLA